MGDLDRVRLVGCLTHFVEALADLVQDDDSITLFVSVSVLPYGDVLFMPGICYDRSGRGESQGENWDLLDDIKSYCQDSPEQNVAVTCGNSHFLASRYLLSCRSGKFRRDLKDLSMNKTIIVNDIDPLILKQMLSFIQDDFSGTWDSGSVADQIRLLSAGLKFEVKVTNGVIIPTNP